MWKNGRIFVWLIRLVGVIVQRRLRADSAGVGNRVAVMKRFLSNAIPSGKWIHLCPCATSDATLPAWSTTSGLP
jgi:hypothetical protein